MGDPLAQTPDTILRTDPRQELDTIMELARAAVQDLDDEAEGRFAADVVALHTHASALIHLVATW